MCQKCARGHTYMNINLLYACMPDHTKNIIYDLIAVLCYIQTALVGFVVILGLSTQTAKKSEDSSNEDDPFPKTPGKGRKTTVVTTPEVKASEKVTAKKVKQGELGAVATPAGKRSLRIAKKKMED